MLNLAPSAATQTPSHQYLQMPSIHASRHFVYIMLGTIPVETMTWSWEGADKCGTHAVFAALRNTIVDPEKLLNLKTVIFEGMDGRLIPVDGMMTALERLRKIPTFSTLEFMNCRNLTQAVMARTLAIVPDVYMG